MGSMFNHYINFKKMEKQEFLDKLKESLELEDDIIDNKTILNISSLTTLSLIVFIDENFGKQFKAIELKNIVTVKDLINLIGENTIQ